MRPMTLRFCLLCAFILSAGCEYDLNKIYQYDMSDAASTASDGAIDAAAEGGGGPVLPDHLIDLFGTDTFVDDACRSCVNQKCASAEDKCRDDKSCTDLLACSAEKVDPDKLSSCRSDLADWCAEDVIGRALGGRFYTCAFRDSCSEECATPSDWSCLGKYTWESTPEPSVPVRIRFAEAVNGTPAAGLTVKVYRRLEDELSNPASMAKTDKDGLVALDLPTPMRSFRGYLQIEGEGWYPTLIQFGYPIARESVVSILIVTDQNVKLSVSSAGTKQRDDLGLLQLRMFGCAGVLMRDVSFASDMADPNSSAVWYYDGQRANTEIDKTTTWGNGGIINVLPGSSDVTAKLGNKLVARTSAPVRAGYLTIVLLAPLDSSQI